MDLADISGLNQFPSLLIVPAAPLLCPDLHNPIVLLRYLSQPSAFTNEDTQRLLDIDIFAGRAGHHRRETMPVIWSRDNDRLQIFVLKHLAEIAIRLRF